jgi:hypothetical protein
MHVGFQIGDQRRAQGLTDRLALCGGFAIEWPLDLEQGVDPAHDLDRDR